MQEVQDSRGEAIRVLVADDTRIHTQLLAEALKRDHGLDVISSPSHSRDLIVAATLHEVEVVVISANLDEEPLRGFEVLRELRAKRPQVQAIVLLDSSKREAIVQAFRAGARGIFSRHESIETLSKCVRSVHQGQIWANSQQMSFAVEALAASPTVRAVDANGLNLLSKRELDVVRSLAEGLTNREIAERLGLSQHTIKNYLFRVFDKLGVSSRLELLFMTLSQAGAPQVLFDGPRNGKGNHREASSGPESKGRSSARPGQSALPAGANGAGAARVAEEKSVRLLGVPGAGEDQPRAEKRDQPSAKKAYGAAAIGAEPVR
jgi:DNA-binding NarL/FixJ family response regulator